MTGGMTPPSGGGVPLKDRPVAGPGAQTKAAGQAQTEAAGQARRARHCWVYSATGDEAVHAGLVIEWRRGSEGWSALVTYVVDDQGSPVVVTQWLDGALLQPAR
ncbi:hypothetical protein OO014_03455 [Intrasporangium calvum]|uniref:Uncharacterized protein n=1 Tax=Intrasporangium calvum TaxID=53358 RepID=A0ABT5GEH1_9MICO|nr:hypothetical protein [Intrasporangium calvum]MDC5696300.1 hypothetical protein [Intrasporangium calvum]